MNLLPFLYVMIYHLESLVTVIQGNSEKTILKMLHLILLPSIKSKIRGVRRFFNQILSSCLNFSEILGLDKILWKVEILTAY